VGSSAFETPTRSSVYTRKPERRSSNPPLISPLFPLGILPFPGQVTNCSPVSSPPPSSYPFIERYSSLSKPSNDPPLAVSDYRFSPDHYRMWVKWVRGRSVTWTATVSRSDISIVSCILFRQTDAFSIHALPFIPRIRGCAASFPLHACNLWIGLLQNRICFTLLLLPPSPLPYSLPFSAPLVCILPSWSRIYALSFMHSTHYKIHGVQTFLSSSPLHHPPLISFH